MSAVGTFKVYPQGHQLVAKAGKWGLYESVLTLKRTDEVSENVAHVTYQRLLLPESDEDYIELADARSRTGLSESELVTLCANGTLKAQKVEMRWTIQLKSLTQYIKNSTDARS
jgi:hypothetical protein